MKQIFLLAIIVLSTTVFGQTTKDSAIKVVYENEANLLKTAFFLNGKFVANFYPALDPQNIDSIYVGKDDSIHNFGKIYIITKKDYNLKLISLTDLKNKYTKVLNKSVVFTIDGKIINTDYDKCLIDENYILQIVVDNIQNDKEHLGIGVIQLLTKSEENIKKSKEIRIRGREVAMY